MTPSPTGIRTEAFLWLRGLQMLGSLILFCVGCGERSRWIVVVALYLPIMLFTLLILLDTIIFYKHRYAVGGGRVSTLRWIADLFVAIILGAAVPITGATHRIVRYTEEGSGPYGVPKAFLLLEYIFIGIVLLLFLCTTIMLCVEDARLRKRGRSMAPSATGAMPQGEEPAYDSMQNHKTLDADQASTITNSILANGFTVQQLEKMGTGSSHAPSSFAKKDYEPGPPTYQA